MSASAAEWIEGARIRTLPNSVAPVLVGAGAAAAIDRFSWAASLLSLVVALSLQVGVNYANDYSDGIRGTDAARVVHCGSWVPAWPRRRRSARRR